MSESESDYVAGEAPALPRMGDTIAESHRRQIAERDARITTLEEALLKTWEHVGDEFGDAWCGVCEGSSLRYMRDPIVHVEGCLIPDILSRHGGNG